MFSQTFGHYTVFTADHLPPQDAAFRGHEKLIEDRVKHVSEEQEDFLYLAVCRNNAPWPFLIVTQYYAPGPDAGFPPGVLLLPETALLLIGAGECLLAYRLDQPAKLWEDTAPVGFWEWQSYPVFPLHNESKRFFLAMKYLISYTNDCSTANRDLIERLTWMRVSMYACTNTNVLLLCA